MFDIRLWPPAVKKTGDTEEELDRENDIAQFLATATLDKGKTPQRWSTIPRSQAHGATYRVSHSPPPQQALLVNQAADLSIHRSVESPRSISTSFPTSLPRAPIHRVPVPSQVTQYLAEAPGPDIIGTSLRETNNSSGRGFSGFYHQLDGAQHPSDPSEVEKAPAEPGEFSIEGRTFRFLFPSHDLVAKPHIEVEGDCPTIDEAVPFCTTDQTFHPAIFSQSNPIELSAEAPPAGEPTFPADSSLSPEVGSGFDANNTLGTKTVFPEESDNMNPPSATLVRDNEYPWIPQGHNTRALVCQTQSRHDRLFDPAQGEQSVQKANDRHPVTTIPTDQSVRDYNRSPARPKFISDPLRADGDRDSPGQSAGSHHHNPQSLLGTSHNQSVPPSSNPRDHDEHTPGPHAQGHAIMNPTVHQSPQTLTNAVRTNENPAVGEEKAPQRSLQVVEGNSLVSSLDYALQEPRSAVEPLSVNDTTTIQWSSEASLSPHIEAAITQTRTTAPNPKQQIENVPRSRHPGSNEVLHQARPTPQTATPRSGSSHNAAPESREQPDLGTSKSTQESGPKQRRKVLGKQQPGSNSPSRDDPEGSKNWGIGVMKKLTGLVGGSGNAMKISYSQEEMTRRCLEFMEQQNIPPSAGLDAFSSILVYARGKWRADEERLHAQSLEIKTLAGRKERFKNELESTQARLQLMTQHRDKLKNDLVTIDGKWTAMEKELRGCRSSIARKTQENKELQKWAQGVEAANEEVYKEGERRIQERERRIHERDLEISRLQKRIASYGTEGFRFVSDDKFQGKMQAAAQTINNLVNNIARPAPESFDANLDATLFLRRNEPYLGNRLWSRFIFGICWGILKRGFFSAPLGFGILGTEGDGYDSLNHIRETLAVYDPTTNMLEVSNNRRTNEVRGFFFERLWADVAAITTAQSAHSAYGDKGVKGLPIYFHKNIDTVTSELVSVLARCSANNLSPLALGLIQELVHDVGFLALEMATQRAHVTLEFCMHGDVIQQGNLYFKEEASLADIVGTARVDLMVEPALIRLGNGKDELAEQQVLRRGGFVALRG